MTRSSQNYYAVLLYGRRIGTLRQRGDYTQFAFNESYLDDAQRPVLGLRFEENLNKPYSSALRLPIWFSNLLPEGPLREWIASARNVALDREMELLAQVGHDLPGAVQVLAVDHPDDMSDWPEMSDRPGGETLSVTGSSPWRFSLAGVALKFSMLAKGDRLTVPASGQHGDWLVKFPDYRFADVPRNEFAMMSLARSVGIETPDVRLVHRDELEGLPPRMWPNAEEWAYAVRRFDRIPDDRRTSVHIEDFAQIRDKYPQSKYEGSFETVAALAHRGHDLEALREAARRIAFCVMIGNGDAHLKNWSLIYRDQRVPTISPAYDLVSTVAYIERGEEPEDLGLKISGSKRFESVRASTFFDLESRINSRMGRTDANLPEIAADVARRVAKEWPKFREELSSNLELASFIEDWISTRKTSLLQVR